MTPNIFPEGYNKAVVTLKKGVDVDGFIAEMTSQPPKSTHLPNRVVEIHNLKPESLRNVDFVLTYDEVVELRKDDRVIDVRYGSKADNNVSITLFGTDPVRTYRREYSYNTAQDDVNWGLYECSSGNVNPFTVGTVSWAYTYALDGTGVDFIISDSGLQIDHPEFQNESGVSRVQVIDWWTAAGRSGPPPWVPDPLQANMPTGFYTDTNGHGTNVCSIAVGKTYGWARNANIYVMKISDTGSISATLGINLIREWHNRKSIDPVTGYKRPTIVNMSWGTVADVTALMPLNNVSVSNSNNSKTWVTFSVSDIPEAQTYGLLPGYSFTGAVRIPYQDSALNADTIDAMEAGVICVAASGNDAYKQVVYSSSSTNEYNATVTYAGTTYSYLRGPSPSGTATNVSQYYANSGPYANVGVISVGAIDYKRNGALAQDAYSVSQAEAKAFFSSTGNRIDVFAPGGSIAGAYSNVGTSATITAPYYANTNYNSARMTGTSQAAPQVSGVLATVLQARPYYNQYDVQVWLRDNSVLKVANAFVGSTPVYTDLLNLQGATPRYLNTPFTSGGSAVTIRNLNGTIGGVL